MCQSSSVEVRQEGARTKGRRNPRMPRGFLREACGPRAVYIDLGANWCNTLDLFRCVPEARNLALPPAAWEVYAFEAAPLITPYLERCVAALNSGRSLPTPPLPPTGSLNDLRPFVHPSNCSIGKRTRAVHLQMEACMTAVLQPKIAALASAPEVRAINGNSALVADRLNTAGRCGSPPRDTFVALPAAAAADDGWMPLYATENALQLVMGGAMPSQTRSGLQDTRKSPFVARKVDVVAWILSNFAVGDMVVLKMDIEGAEQEVCCAMAVQENACMHANESGLCLSLSISRLSGVTALGWHPTLVNRLNISSVYLPCRWCKDC